MNKFSMRLAPVACAAGLLLSACGGGGGGDSAPTSPGVTASNYQELAGSVAESTLSVVTTADALRGFTGLESIQEAGQASARSADPVGLLRFLLANGTPGREQPQQTQSESIACPEGGYMDVSATDADNNNALSRGDSASIQLHGCIIEGETLSGGLGVSVTQLGASSGALSLSFNGLSAQGATINGNAAVSFSTGAVNSMAVSLNNVTFNDGSTSVRANYTVDLAASEGTSSVSVHGGVVLDGHDYVLTQPVAFTQAGAGLQPGGTLQIREAAFGERVLLRADSGHFTYQYFAPGNNGSTPDHSSVGLAY
jgi:hypothetical protein